MKKVYQSRVNKGYGTCMQAVVASLFEVFLEDVPNFRELGANWFNTEYIFYKERGYSLGCWSVKGDIELTKKVLAYDGGIKGYWGATVDSIFLGMGVTHSVIIDKDMNVIHDPNPNNHGHRYSPEDIIAIDLCKDGYHVDVNGNIVVTGEEYPPHGRKKNI